MDAIIDFVAGYVDPAIESTAGYSPISGIVQYPSETVGSHTGTPLDVALLAVSLLRGVGYDAWCVVGELVVVMGNDPLLPLHAEEAQILATLIGNEPSRVMSTSDAPTITQTLPCVWGYVRGGLRNVREDVSFDPSSGQSIHPSSIRGIHYMFSDMDVMVPFAPWTRSYESKLYDCVSFKRYSREDRILSLPSQVISDRYPSRVRTQFYERAVRTRFAQFDQPCGLVEQVSRFWDSGRTELRYTFERFCDRSDRLVSRLRWEAGSEFEQFKSGRIDSVFRRIIDVENTIREIQIYPESRPDGLVRVMERNFTEDTFDFDGTRNDGIVYVVWDGRRMEIGFGDEAVHWLDPESVSSNFAEIVFDQGIEAIGRDGEVAQLGITMMGKCKEFKGQVIALVEGLIVEFEKFFASRLDEDNAVIVVKQRRQAEERIVGTDDEIVPESDIAKFLGEDITTLSPESVYEKTTGKLADIKQALLRTLTQEQSLFNQNKARMETRASEANEDELREFRNTQASVWFRIELVERKLAKHEVLTHKLLSELNRAGYG
jgi:hypothetical protein